MMKRSEEIKEMFNKIAPNYDFLNEKISFGTHKFVKKQAMKLLNLESNANVLDICTGSGDLIDIVKYYYPNCNITGIDFSEKMLEIAKKKYPKITFSVQNASELNFYDATFDCVTSAFGFRNIQEKTKTLNEISRVLKNGGYFMHLDFGAKHIIAKIYNLIALMLAKKCSKDFDAYKYLIKSINNFLPPKELIKNFEKHNFKLIKRKDFFFGIISCQIMQKCID